MTHVAKHEMLAMQSQFHAVCFSILLSIAKVDSKQHLSKLRFRSDLICGVARDANFAYPGFRWSWHCRLSGKDDLTAQYNEGTAFGAEETSTQVYVQQTGDHVVVRVGGGYKSLQVRHDLNNWFIEHIPSFLESERWKSWSQVFMDAGSSVCAASSK